jgi:hypothetical protein
MKHSMAARLSPDVVQLSHASVSWAMHVFLWSYIIVVFFILVGTHSPKKSFYTLTRAAFCSSARSIRQHLCDVGRTILLVLETICVNLASAEPLKFSS